MDDLNRSICEYIKSKQYFTDARNWYTSKFVYSITERTYIGLCSLLLALSFLIIFSYFSQLNHSKDYWYLEKIDDLTKNFAVIKEIGTIKSNPQIDIEELMIKKYVNERESYNYSKLNDILAGKILYLQNTSSPQEYQKYINSISLNNTLSPLYIYEDLIIVKVNINNVLINNNDPQNKKAVVYFVKKNQNLATNEVTTKNYIANISYTIDNIEQVINQKELNFRVFGYNIKDTEKN